MALAQINELLVAGNAVTLSGNANTATLHDCNKMDFKEGKLIVVDLKGYDDLITDDEWLGELKRLHQVCKCDKSAFEGRTQHVGFSTTVPPRY